MGTAQHSAKAVKNNDRGIALMTVLVTVTLSAMLLGAFLVSNRGHISHLKGGQDSDLVEAGVASAFEYAKFKLEHDKTWGSAPFSQDSLDGDATWSLQMEEKQGAASDPEALVEGTTKDGSTIEMRIINNLDGTGARDGVLEGQCRIRVFCRKNNREIGQEIILQTPPLYDSAIASSEGINIDAESVVFDSKDKVRNQIRSKKDIVLGSTGSSFDFRRGENPNSANQGLVWSQEGITLAGDDLRDVNNLADAQQQTKGQFVTDAESRLDLHNLTVDEVKLGRQAVSIEPGYWVFADAEVDYSGGRTTIPMLQRRTIRDQESSTEEFYFLHRELPGWFNNDSASLTAAPGAASFHKGFFSGDKFELEPGLEVDMGRGSFELNADYNLDVQGDFALFSTSGIDPQVTFVDGNNSGTTRGSVTVRGNLEIEGYVKGSGNLIAEGDVLLRPNSVDTEADTESDLAVYSGNNVTIIPPASWTSPERQLNFRGLVYAQNNFDFYAHTEYHGESQTLNIEGALIARDGQVRIHNAKETRITYNPEYLDSLVKELPDNRTHVEVLLWRPL